MKSQCSGSLITARAEIDPTDARSGAPESNTANLLRQNLILVDPTTKGFGLRFDLLFEVILHAEGKLTTQEPSRQGAKLTDDAFYSVAWRAQPLLGT